MTADASGLDEMVQQLLAKGSRPRKGLHFLQVWCASRFGLVACVLTTAWLLWLTGQSTGH